MFQLPLYGVAQSLYHRAPSTSIGRVPYVSACVFKITYEVVVDISIT